MRKYSLLLKSITGAKNLAPEAKFLQMQQPILRHLLPVLLANSKALINYVPKAYLGKITLFKTNQTLGDKQDKYWGWQDFSLKDLETLQISGHHLNCLRMPHVKVMAEKLANCLVSNI